MIGSSLSSGGRLSTHCKLESMALSVPYHPYSVCLICGRGHSVDTSAYQNFSVKLDTKRNLQKCSGCKQALYCGLECQVNDWNVHKRSGIVGVTNEFMLEQLEYST